MFVVNFNLKKINSTSRTSVGVEKNRFVFISGVGERQIPEALLRDGQSLIIASIRHRTLG